MSDFNGVGSTLLQVRPVYLIIFWISVKIPWLRYPHITSAISNTYCQFFRVILNMSCSATILPVMYERLYAGMHPCMKENPLNTGLQNICDNYFYSLWTLVTSRGVLTFKNLILGPNLEKNKKAKPLLSFWPQSEIFWAPNLDPHTVVHQIGEYNQNFQNWKKLCQKVFLSSEYSNIARCFN